MIPENLVRTVRDLKDSEIPLSELDTIFKTLAEFQQAILYEFFPKGKVYPAAVLKKFETISGMDLNCLRTLERVAFSILMRRLERLN
jgi:hypothetical protein